MASSSGNDPPPTKSGNDDNKDSREKARAGRTGVRVGKYERLDVIGRGTFGTVYKAKDLSHSGHIVALKELELESKRNEGVPAAALREISTLKSLARMRNPNIIRLLDVFVGSRDIEENKLTIYLAFEYVHQDLATYIRSCEEICHGRIKSIGFQILYGLDFLHSNRILHGDLKPQNVLISNDGKVKLTDFGLSRFFDSPTALTSVVVTLWYRPPEVLLGQAYASPVDVWSAGCVLGELYKKGPMFPGEDELDQLKKIFSVIGRPSASEWPHSSHFQWESFSFSHALPLQRVIPSITEDAEHLIMTMLEFCPEQRISCKEALRHPYFH